MAPPCINAECKRAGSIKCDYCDANFCHWRCQQSHFKIPKEHKGHYECPDEVVRAVKLGAVKNSFEEQCTYQAVLIKPNDFIFLNVPTPITQKLKYPLVVRRTDFQFLEITGDLNPHACWLNMDPETGIAPTHWQSGVGNVIVARADKQPLNIRALDVFTDHLWEILGVTEWKPKMEEMCKGEKLKVLHEKLAKAIE